MSNSQYSNDETIGQAASRFDESQHHDVKVINQYGDSLVESQGFLSKLFPEEKKMAIALLELQSIKSEFEFKAKALEMVRQSQIQAIKEQCNAYLFEKKASARGYTTTNFAKKTQELMDELEGINNKFFDSVGRRMQQIEKAPHPMLKQKLERDLENDIMNFPKLIATLKERFNSIVSEDS